MKKLLLILTLTTFVAPMAMNTYAAANGNKIELNDDDDDKLWDNTLLDGLENM